MRMLPETSRNAIRRPSNAVGLVLALILVGGPSTLSGLPSDPLQPSNDVICEACVPPCHCEADFLSTTCLTPNYNCKCNAG